MGCASSKKKRCRHCQTPYSPVTRRSFSMNVHHPLVREGHNDNYHLVALASSTLGSVKLDTLPRQIESGTKWLDDFEEESDENRKTPDVGIDTKEKFAMGMIEAKAWSKKIDEKITRVVPKTPIRTPPGEPETINVEDLMEGLEDTSPFRSGDHLRSFSFHVSVDSIPLLVDSPRTVPQKDELGSPRKTWFEEPKKENALSNGNSISNAIVSDFDPEVISAFRKALEGLSPTNPFHLKPGDHDCQQQVAKNGVREEQDVNGIKSFEVVDKKLDGTSAIEHIEEEINEDVTEEKTVISGVVASNGFTQVNDFVEKINNRIVAENGYVHTNGSEEKETTEGEYDGFVVENVHVNIAKDKVVLYFTSLRGVRRTYEDCCNVRLILKGLGVRVDERDVSMHSGFKEELKELLGDGFRGGLPKVFVGERYIGGADEIRRMHEDGQLENLLQGCQMLEDDGGNLVDVCEACGDIRFVPCETCSGSCKIYCESEDDNQEHEEDEYGFQRCPDCNENGLVRCPICCY